MVISAGAGVVNLGVKRRGWLQNSIEYRGVSGRFSGGVAGIVPLAWSPSYLRG